MAPPGRSARIVMAVSAALLIAYAILFAQVSRTDIGRSDFTAFYVGGTLLRQGAGASLYDEAVQAPLHSHLIAPDHEGNLPFVDPPVAAALVAPVTLLGLDTAYRVWALVELVALVAAVAVAVRGSPRATGWTAALTALAGAGTFFAVVQAQWTPVAALGLALAFRWWRRGEGRPSRREAALGAAVLIGAAAIGKPQLAVGLVVFLIGWRRRGVLLGGLAAVVALVLLSLALVGPAGISGLARIVEGSTTRWDPHLMVGASGLAAAFAGGGAAAAALTAVISVAACAAAYVLGSHARRNPATLPVALAGAAALSLLAAPHAYLDDLALLAPAAAWSVALEFTRWRGAPAAAVGLWFALGAAAVLDLATGGRLITGPATAYVLAAMGALALASSGASVRLRVRYRARREAAVGALADGLRRG